MKTYDEWRDAGYQVRRGERAQLVNGREGIQRVFTRDQVEERRDFDKVEGDRNVR